MPQPSTSGQSEVHIYPQPECIIPARADVGEGPVIDSRTGRLIWVDITGGNLHEYDFERKTSTYAHIDTMLGAAVPRATKPGFAVAVADGYGYMVDGQLELVAADFSQPSHRSNDAKCDSKGRLWAGSNDLTFTPGAGKLRLWDGGYQAQIMQEGLTLPNGIGWNAADDEMYLADSMVRRLYVASFNATVGTIGELRILAEFTESDGLPDGLAVDTDGGIWVAMWGAAQVLRLDRFGTVVARVPMPCVQPSSCAFGADGTLYITSATAGLSAEDIVAQPLAGSVFALQTNYRGVSVAAFAG